MKGSDEMWRKLKESGLFKCLEVLGTILTITDILVTIFL